MLPILKQEPLLFGWKLAELDNGAGKHVLAGSGKHVEPLDRLTPLLTLGRCEALQRLRAVKNSIPLLRIHVVKPRERVQAILLHLRGKRAEAGFVLKSALLLGQ